MRFIANRGNTDKKRPYFENKPEYVDAAVLAGYDCKVDVWWRDGDFWLGHDAPRYMVPEVLLEQRQLWCQAKNIEAMERMMKNEHIHSFWCNELYDYQNHTLTSKGFLWSNDVDIVKGTLDCVLYVDEITGVVPHTLGICANNVKYAREFITEEKAPIMNLNKARRIEDILPDDFFTRDLI